MDQANYGGVSVALPRSLESVNEGLGEEEGVEGEGSEVMEVEYEDQKSEEIVVNWNIRQYLPQAGSCQDLFTVSLIPIFHSKYRSIFVYTVVYNSWSYIGLIQALPGGAGKSHP